MSNYFRIIIYFCVAVVIGCAAQESVITSENPIKYWRSSLPNNSIESHLIVQTHNDKLKVFYRFIPTSDQGNCDKNYEAKRIAGQLELTFNSGDREIIPFTDTNANRNYEEFGILRIRDVRIGKTHNIKDSKFSYCRIDLDWELRRPITNSIKEMRFNIYAVINSDVDGDIIIDSSGVLESGDWQGLYDGDS